MLSAWSDLPEKDQKEIYLLLDEVDKESLRFMACVEPKFTDWYVYPNGLKRDFTGYGVSSREIGKL